jgi:RNA polymerase sigma factor (sigma-70 family)
MPNNSHLSEATDSQASGEALFLAKLPAIDRVIRFSCWRGSLEDADAEDFASWVKLKLIESDYAALRKFENRCSFAAYISIVVQRLLLDYRVQLWGKWHPSTEAKHIGEVGVAIESLLVRDGMAVTDAMPALRRDWPDLTEQRVYEIAARLPKRFPRPRAVELEKANGEASPCRVNETSFETDRTSLAEEVSAVVREALEEYSEDDRLLLRLHFHSGTSIADIARMLVVDQKPLYRKLQRLLADLRTRLKRRNIDATDLDDIIGHGHIGVDFGFEARTLPPCLSNQQNDITGGDET